MQDFKYSKVDVIIKGKKPHEFIGSMIRGALGYSLKKVVCINPSFICKDCFAIQNCLYYEFYEVLNIYHKYRIDFDLNDKFFRFSIYLFDDRANNLPYIISALVNLLTKTGLGKKQVTFKDFYLYVNEKEIYDGKNFKLMPEYTKSFFIDTYSPNITLQFKTPLRIKNDNKFLKAEKFKLEYLLNSIYQRYLQLTNQNRVKLPFTPIYKKIKANLYFQELTRFSNREKTKMSMDGYMGEIIYTNLDKQSYELLKLGEIIGAGKQTVMGLGKIEIVNKED